MTPTDETTIDGPGTVTGSPGLPDGFAATFRSVVVDTGDVRLHAVIGGDGPPLLLVAGWPQTWYAWRLVMPELARTRSVVAVEARGVGRSDKPEAGYDTATLAADLVAAMRALGHGHFDMVGHDVGMWTGYALAADHPEVLRRLVVMEAVLPGISPSPPLLGPSAANHKLWHFAFNRLPGLNEELVRGREDVFFPVQFRSKAATPTAIPDGAVAEYVGALARSDAALRASFEFYRQLDATIAQNAARVAARRLTLPVLAVGGEANLGPLVGQTMQLVADDVRTSVLPGVGHYPPEEDPAAVLHAITDFLDR